MKLGFKGKALVAAAVMAFGGAAHANTSINESTTGSLILNVVDANGLSFVFDTGLVQSTFDQNGYYSFNVSGDANYQAFLAGAGTGDLLYNVISADNQNPGATTEDNALSTIASFGGTTRNSGLNNAMNNASIYADSVNGVGSPTLNSAYVSSTADPANFGNFNAAWAGGLQATVSGLVGTALQFYSINFNGTNKTSPSLASIRTALAQTWMFQDGVLTYGTQTAPVPLPAPFALLLGGLAMMGAMSRRRSEEKA